MRLLFALSFLMLFSVSFAQPTLYEEVPCRFETRIQGVECGDLTVPEDRNQPEKTIKLHVAIIRAKSDTPQSDPVVYLSGGPGGYNLLFFDTFQSLLPLYRERDLIVLDQRGVGLSEPSLDCPEVTVFESDTLNIELTEEAALDRYLEVVAACRNRLVAEGVNLSAYNTDANAADVNDLRIALGYEQWNLYGVSYGTSLAQTIMRDYPETIRSAVLDSPLLLSSDWVANRALLAEQAFTRLFAACEADEACAGAYPDLETVVYTLAAQLNDEPVRVAITAPNTGEPVEVVLDGKDFLQVLNRTLYFPQSIGETPRMIYAAKAGDYQMFGLYEYFDSLEESGYSIGMNYSVLCSDNSEVVPQGSPFDLLNDAFSSEEFTALCEVWDVLPRENSSPLINSTVPTLLQYGQFDPIVPTINAPSITEGLVNAYTVEYPGLSHIVTLSSNCPRAMMIEFFDDPSQRPDGKCIERLDTPEFAR